MKKISHQINTNNQSGFITLMSVLVASAIVVAVSISLLLLGLGSSRTSFSQEQANQAKALANACTEEALQQIRDLSSYSGSGNITMGQGTCTYTVFNLGGSSRRVEASGSVGSVIKKVKIIINRIRPLINITSWQEVGDF